MLYLRIYCEGKRVPDICTRVGLPCGGGATRCRCALLSWVASNWLTTAVTETVTDPLLYYCKGSTTLVLPGLSRLTDHGFVGQPSSYNNCGHVPSRIYFSAAACGLLLAHAPLDLTLPLSARASRLQQTDRSFVARCLYFPHGEGLFKANLPLASLFYTSCSGPSRGSPG